MNIGMGGPGFEKCLVAEKVIQDAKEKGLSFRKNYNRLGGNVEWGSAQVVSDSIGLIRIYRLVYLERSHCSRRFERRRR